MSQSGIPVVSDVAQAVGTAIASVGDIFKGKNVLEAAGRIITAPLAAQLSSYASEANLVTSLTGEKIDIPVATDLFNSAKSYNFDPYNKAKASDFAKNVAITTATVVGGGYLAAPIASVTGLGAGASTALGLSVANKAAKGDIGGIFDIAKGAASGYVSNYVNNTDLGQYLGNLPTVPNIPGLPNIPGVDSSQLSGIASSLSGLVSQVSSQGNKISAINEKTTGASVIPAINNVTPAAQVLNTSTGFSGAQLLMFAIIGVGGYYLAKKERLI